MRRLQRTLATDRDPARQGLKITPPCGFEQNSRDQQLSRSGVGAHRPSPYRDPCCLEEHVAPVSYNLADLLDDDGDRLPRRHPSPRLTFGLSAGHAVPLLLAPTRSTTHYGSRTLVRFTMKA